MLQGLKGLNLDLSYPLTGLIGFSPILVINRAIIPFASRQGVPRVSR